MKIRALLLLISLVGALAVAAPAMASPGSDAYGGVLGEQASGGNGDVAGVSAGHNGGGQKGDVAAAQNTGGSLPFTGFQAGLVLVIGVALVGTGFAVRRVTGTGGTARLS